MAFLNEDIEYVKDFSEDNEPAENNHQNVIRYTFSQAYAIAAELKAMPAFELGPEWAIETITEIVDLKERLKHWEPLSALSMNLSLARHFDSCDRRIREVNYRFLAMERLYDRVFDAESTDHFDACPEWARSAVKSFLDAWDTWEETAELRVYSENALRHVRSALGCIRSVNERTEQSQTTSSETATA